MLCSMRVSLSPCFIHYIFLSPLLQLLFIPHYPFFMVDFFFSCAMAMGKSVLRPFPVPKMAVASVILLGKAGYILAFSPFMDKYDNLVQVVLTGASLAAVNITFLLEYVEMPTLAIQASSIVLIVGYGGAIVALLMLIFYVLIMKETPAELLQKRLDEARDIEIEVGRLFSFLKPIWLLAYVFLCTSLSLLSLFLVPLRSWANVFPTMTGSKQS